MDPSAKSEGSHAPQIPSAPLSHPAPRSHPAPLSPPTPPPEIVPPRAPVKHVDSTALTKEDYGDWEAVLANIPSNLSAEQLENIAWDQIENDQQTSRSAEETPKPAQTALPPVFVPDDSALTGLPPVEFADDSHSSSSASGDSPEFVHRRQDYIPLPNANAAKAITSPSSPAHAATHQKTYVLVATIGLAGTLLAGLGFWGFLKLVASPRPPVALAPSATGENATGNNAEGSTTSSTGEVASEASLSAEEIPPDAIVTAEGDPEAIGGEEPLPEEVGSDETGSDEAASNSSEGADEELPEEELPEDEMSMLPDILNLPSDQALTKQAEESQAEPANEPGAAPEETPSALDALPGAADDSTEVSENLPELFGPNGFGQLLTPHMNIDDTSLRGKAPLAELDLERLEEANAVYFHPDPQSVPSWPERTDSLPISRIRFNKTSLASCIDLFSRMTGVGITIDWPTLRASGIDESISVTADLQDQNIDQVVRSVLEQSKLYLEIPADGLPLVRAKSESPLKTSKSVWDLDASISKNETHTVALDTSALDTYGASNSSSLAELLVELWGIPAECMAQGNQLHWEPSATPLAKASVWTTLKLLMELSGQGTFEWPEQTDAPLQLFDPEDWHQSQGLLHRQVPVSVVIPEARAVSELLSIAAKESGSEVLIDWQSVWQHGLVPTQSEYAVLRNRTLPQISKRFQDQYALELVSIGRNKVLVTTPESRRTRFIVVPIRLPDGVTIDEMKRSLYLLAPSNLEGRTLFKVSPVPGMSGIYLARITMPKIEQLDDDELHLAFGWEKAAAPESN